MTVVAKDMLEEEILEEYYEGLCKGDYDSVNALPLNERIQVLVFAEAKNAQWLLQLEQRTRS